MQTNNPKNDADELRESLFDTLRGIKNKSISIEEAQAVRDVAQTLINLAKVEVEYSKAIGTAVDSKFLPKPDDPNAVIPAHPGGLKVLGITTHRIC